MRPVAVAITGGIGAGKSTALDAFRAHGAATVSSDEIVHHLLATDDAVRDALVDRLGKGILGPHGRPDRVAIAQAARWVAEELQVPVTQAASLGEYLLARLARENVDRDSLGHILDRAGSVFHDRRGRRGRVQREDEDLFRIDPVVAVHRQ